MLLFSQTRQRIINVPVVQLAAFVVVASALVLAPEARHNVALYVFAGFFLFAALPAFCVVTRVERRLRVWGPLGTEWVPVQTAFLMITTRAGHRGGGSVDVDLMTGASSPYQATVQVLTSHLAGLEKPTRDAERIARVLSLPPPRLASWLQPGDTAGPPPPPERMSWRELFLSRWTFAAMVLAAIAVALIGSFSLSHLEAELYLRCRTPHQIKFPIGELLVRGSTGFDLKPGEATVEVWLPDLGCWTQRVVTLKRGTKTILDLDEMAAPNRCDRRGSPPLSPGPNEPRRR